jgi:ribonuclease PH
MTTRADGRGPEDLRPLNFTRDYTDFAAGSVLVEMGRTKVICTASVEDRIPPWLRGKGRGWVTAEYSMLPGSTTERTEREAARGKVSGRTASISGAYVALHDACTRLVAAKRIPAHPLTEGVAAVSVGIVGAVALLDLPYVEDVKAEVDMNVVMTTSGRFVEVQGTAEGKAFSKAELDDLLSLAEHGIAEILEAQVKVLATPPPPRTK